MKSFALAGAKKVSPPRWAVLDITDLLMEVRELAGTDNRTESPNKTQDDLD